SLDGEIWIVGGSAASAGIVIHWDAQTLGDLAQLKSYPVKTLEAIWTAGPGEAFAAGDDSILHFHNAALVMDAATQTSGVDGLTSVWGSSPSDVWATRSLTNLASSYNLKHFDGTKWTDFDLSRSSSPNLGDYLLSLSGTRPDDIWVTDTGGNLLRWNGAYWL